MIIFIGAVLGLAAAIFFPLHIPPAYTQYAAIAILAGLDSVMGGFSAFFRKKFDMHVFISGVVSNAAIAAGLVYLGNKLGFDMSIAAVVTFGSRIFQNFALIRRLLLKKFEKHSTIEGKG